MFSAQRMRFCASMMLVLSFFWCILLISARWRFTLGSMELLVIEMQECDGKMWRGGFSRVHYVELF